MRKSYIAFLLLGGLALGIGLYNSLILSGDVNPPPLQASTSQPPANALAIEQLNSVSQPTIFRIPKLDVQNIMIESVGLDKEGKMDIPKDENNVAWYNLGSKPGERGNAVIAGHFDKKTGQPAVFYGLNKLLPGDELKVKDQEGNEYTYAVTEVKSYELADFPLVEVFGAGDKARLNLITCEGTYNKSSKLYSHRLVVYSELQSD